MNGMFALAGAFAVAGAFALSAAINAIRWGDRARSRRLLVIGFPLAVASCAVLWLAVQHPNTNFRGNQGFGPDWECDILGKGGAQVCFRDAPNRTSKPSAAPN